MEEARTTAWIMYSLSLASLQGPANFAAISQIADGVNHAVPTHKELQSSLKSLAENGMAQKVGSGYLLTPQGSAVMASAQAKHTTMFQVWAALTNALVGCTE